MKVNKLNKEREFRHVVLKALRTLVRGMVLHGPLFWKRESDVWDWGEEMKEAEEGLWKFEDDL